MSIFVDGGGVDVDLGVLAEAGAMDDRGLPPSLEALDVPRVRLNISWPQTLAASLMAIPRYCGGTSQPISVGQHLLWCVAFAQVIDERVLEEIDCGGIDRTQLMLEVLAHDLAETLTGDIPSPFKRMLGPEALRVHNEVERAFVGGFLATRPEIAKVKDPCERTPYLRAVALIDTLALIPEAHLRPKSARSILVDYLRFSQSLSEETLRQGVTAATSAAVFDARAAFLLLHARPLRLAESDAAPPTTEEAEVLAEHRVRQRERAFLFSLLSATRPADFRQVAGEVLVEATAHLRNWS